MRSPRWIIAITLCLGAACSDDTAPTPDKGTPKPEARVPDQGPKPEVAVPDLAKTDVAKTDVAKTDLAKTDLAKTDLAKTDLAKTDLAKTDVAKTDGPAGACNTLVNTAPIHQEKAGTGTMPTLTGGTIVLGKYHRTETLYWSSVKTRYVQETIQITNLAPTVYKMEFVNATGNTSPPSPEYHVNVELTLTGAAGVDYKIVCGTTGTIPTTYQANATTFTLRLGSADLIYTRQP